MAFLFPVVCVSKIQQSRSTSGKGNQVGKMMKDMNHLAKSMELPEEEGLSSGCGVALPDGSLWRKGER